MKEDIGIGSYPVKIAGVIVSSISLIGFLVCKLTHYNPQVFENIQLVRLFSILFASGLFLFLFSKDKDKVDDYIYHTNMISRYFLTALYACLIVFSLIQSLNKDYDVDILAPVLFFLILQLIYTVVLRLNKLSNKGFYIFSTLLFVAGLIILLLL